MVRFDNSKNFNFYGEINFMVKFDNLKILIFIGNLPGDTLRFSALKRYPLTRPPGL